MIPTGEEEAFPEYQRTVYDRHEIMAYVARSRTGPVGQVGVTGGAIHRAHDLGAAPFSFEWWREDHSAQFRWDIQESMEPFYSLLLRETGNEPTVYVPTDDL